jgi:esterase/lipase
MTKRNVMMIHGAWSSRDSFNHITKMIEMYLESYVRHIIYLEYNPNNESVYDAVQKANKELSSDDTETLVIGHSLGGLIALHVSDHKNCYRVITMASPLSGIKINRMFRPFLYARAPILADIAPDSDFVRGLKKKTYEKRVDSLITTRGYNPLMTEKSDGVVSIETQEAWLPSTAVATYVSNNHYEILQSDQAFSAIRKALINQ